MMRWFLVPSSGLQWAAPDCGNGYDHHHFDHHHYHFDDHHHLDDHHYQFDDHHHYQFDDQHHLDDHHYNFDDQHYNLDGDHHLNDQYSVTTQLPFDHPRWDTMVKGGRDMALVKLAEEGLDLRDHPIQHYLTGSRINIVFYPISPSPVTGIRGVDVKPSRVTFPPDDTDDTLQLSKFSPDNNLQVSPLVTHALLARERMRMLSPKHLV